MLKLSYPGIQITYHIPNALQICLQLRLQILTQFIELLVYHSMVFLQFVHSSRNLPTYVQILLVRKAGIRVQTHLVVRHC